MISGFSSLTALLNDIIFPDRPYESIWVHNKSSPLWCRVESNPNKSPLSTNSFIAALSNKMLTCLEVHAGACKYLHKDV